MSAHDECSRPGKFGCWADETIHASTLDSGAGEGDVAAPCAWFEVVDLETECEGHESLNGADMGRSIECDGSCMPEWKLAQHYGTRWLIARENSDGRFWVECYDTEAARDERVEGLRESWNEWAGELL